MASVRAAGLCPAPAPAAAQQPQRQAAYDGRARHRCTGGTREECFKGLSDQAFQVVCEHRAAQSVLPTDRQFSTPRLSSFICWEKISREGTGHREKSITTNGPAGFCWVLFPFFFSLFFSCSSVFGGDRDRDVSCKGKIICLIPEDQRQKP